MIAKKIGCYGRRLLRRIIAKKSDWEKAVTTESG